MYNSSRTTTYSQTQPRAGVLSRFMRGVYGWMTAGLGLTALMSFFVSQTPALRTLVFGTPGLVIGLMIVEVIMVIYLAARVNRMSAGAATALFLAYSALNGVTLSGIFMVYTAASLTRAFVICCGMFGAMTLYGLTTKRDLTGMGSFLFMGLIGMIIASVVNIFLGSSMLDWIVSAVGVLVFTGLTAYDTQKFMLWGETMPDDATVVRRGQIIGALSLYLDFINLFILMLRFFGGSRD